MQISCFCSWGIYHINNKVGCHAGKLPGDEWCFKVDFAVGFSFLNLFSRENVASTELCKIWVGVGRRIWCWRFLLWTWSTVRSDPPRDDGKWTGWETTRDWRAQQRTGRNEGCLWDWGAEAGVFTLCGFSFVTQKSKIGNVNDSIDTFFKGKPHLKGDLEFLKGFLKGDLESPRDIWPYIYIINSIA